MMKYKPEQMIGRPKEKREQCVENPRVNTIEKEIRSRSKAGSMTTCVAHIYGHGAKGRIRNPDPLIFVT
jgi:hypothetical protein